MNILLTGATGLVGGHILFELIPRYLDGTYKGKIYLPIRPSNNMNGLERVSNILKLSPAFLSNFDKKEVMSFIEVIEGDLTDPNFHLSIGERIPKAEKLHVLHSAGSVKLSNNEKTEREILENNYLATKRLVEAFQGHQVKFSFISTAFASGVREGKISNDFLSLSNYQFRNPYEKYKNVTEKYLYDKSKNANFEYQILRPSVVIGRLLEKPLYITTKFDVIYGWTKFFWSIVQRGEYLEKVRINVSNGGLNMVPVDYVAKACVKALSEKHTQINIAQTVSTNNRQWMKRALDYVGYTNYEFVTEAPTDLNETEQLYYRTVGKIFGPYFTCPLTEYDTELVRDMLAEVREPDVMTNIPKLLDFAVVNKFDEVIT